MEIVLLNVYFILIQKVIEFQGPSSCLREDQQAKPGGTYGKEKRGSYEEYISLSTVSAVVRARAGFWGVHSAVD